MNENTERLFELLDSCEHHALAHVEDRDDMVALAAWLDEKGVRAPAPPPKLAAGWGMPALGRKWHYFPADDITSVCGKWGFTGEREAATKPGPDDCAACRRKAEQIGGYSGG